MSFGGNVQMPSRIPETVTSLWLLTKGKVTDFQLSAKGRKPEEKEANHAWSEAT